MIPVNEYHDWDYGYPSRLTCKNHPDLFWNWKGPGRNLHYTSWHKAPECSCPFADLRVMVEGPLTKEQSNAE